ncbi:MAG: mechanosensitive ion channel domain-containing protein [Pseudomonadota bacterium]
MEELSENPVLDRLANALGAWSPETTPEALLFALLMLVAVIVLRKPLAALSARVIESVLKALSINVSESMRVEFNAALRVIVVAGTALLLMDVVDLPDVFGGVVRRLLVSVLVLAVFATWYRLVEPFISLLDVKKSDQKLTDTTWIVRLAQFIVILLAITAVMAVWEIDISTALTGVGVFGAGLAIAAQDFVRNLFAGMANASEKRFAPGDWIAVEGGVEGIVSRVDVRSTTVLGFDRVPRYVPNADLSNATVLNKSRMDHRRVYLTIPLVLDASDEQIGQVCEALNTYLSECGDFVDDGSLFMMVTPVGLGEASLDVMIYAFTKGSTYQDYLSASSGLALAVRGAVRDAETSLAYPTQTVMLRTIDNP